MRPQLPEGQTAHFSYEVALSKRPPRGKEAPVLTVHVHASITTRNGANVLATGHAVLNPEEVFSEQLGRDIALGRALKKLEREQREQELELVVTTR